MAYRVITTRCFGDPGGHLARSRKQIPTIEPSLSELSDWLSGVHDQICRQVTVHEKEHASGKRTVVTIDHRLSCDLGGHAGWHVRTRQTFLPNAHFSSEVRTKIKNAAQMRGRAIYCDDLLDPELVAAVAYHVDEDSRMPIFLTELGFRTDIAGNAVIRSKSLSGALVLKHHVHAISDRIGRGDSVHIELAPGSEEFDLACQLGFKPAPKIKGYRPGGQHLRQSLSG